MPVGVTVAVLDTNVLASGFIGEEQPDSVSGALIRRWRGKTFTLVISEPILAELADTFADRYFARRLSSSEIADALQALRVDAVIQPLTVAVAGVASHPEDDLILATALSARAPYLVTGDRRLRERVAYHGTQLLAPRQFLELIEREATP